MDSLELVRIRNDLSSELGMDLPATMLLDFPNVEALAAQLDKERKLGAEPSNSRAMAKIEADSSIRPVSSWDSVTPSEIIELQTRYKTAYRQAHYQKKFNELAKKCYPDMLKYVLSIENILNEVEGPLLMEFGLCEGSDWRTVQAAREEMTTVTLKFWMNEPEIRMLGSELVHLTKQDQSWQ